MVASAAVCLGIGGCATTEMDASDGTETVAPTETTSASPSETGRLELCENLPDAPVTDDATLAELVQLYERLVVDLQTSDEVMGFAVKTDKGRIALLVEDPRGQHDGLLQTLQVELGEDQACLEQFEEAVPLTPR